MLLKILSKIVLRHFTIKATNVLCFCFATRLLSQTNPNKKMNRCNKVLSTYAASAQLNYFASHGNYQDR